MEELAIRQAGIAPSGGVLFARTVAREKKDAARQLVLDLFHPSCWDRPLRMLTMPGVHWRFERLLLATREVGWMRASNPQRTRFTSVENDRAIYFGAAAQMPGLHTPKSTVKRIKPYSFAEMGIRTSYAAFFFANVDDMMAHKEWSGWDAVGLDYTGPLSVKRLKLIQHFYQHFVRDTLIVTALEGRWNSETSDAIDRAGGHSEWLRDHLPGEVLHDIEYLDTAPMSQFAVRHCRQ
jgi:hypothetical protein